MYEESSKLPAISSGTSISNLHIYRLASPAPIGERELPGQRDDLAPVPTRCWFRAAQGKQPLGIGKLPEVKLWAAKPGLQAARIGHFRDLLILREPNGIQRERRGLVLDFERAFVDSHGDLFSGKPIFPKEFPVLEPDVAVFVEMTRKLGGIQCPREHLFWNGAPQHST